MRGRAIMFVAFICTSWTIFRILISTAHQPPVIARQQNDQQVTPLAQNISGKPISVAQPPGDPGKATRQTQITGSAPQSRQRQVEAPNFQHAPDPRTVGPDLVGAPYPRVDGKNADRFDGQLSLPPLGAAKPSTTRRFAIHAYSFWRAGGVQSQQIANGQYGASQSAIILTVPVHASRDTNSAPLAVFGRVAVAHGKMGERQLAAGLQWRPVRSLPAHMAVERRFQPNRPDSAAIYVAGGQEGIRLPHGFVLGVYGQAGLQTGQDAGAFADVQLGTLRRVMGDKGATVAAGAGVWGGGQDKIMRLDIGPSARAVVPVGTAQLRIDASWRFRIAGRAQPGNGPAVTLSTSF